MQLNINSISLINPYSKDIIYYKENHQNIKIKSYNLDDALKVNNWKVDLLHINLDNIDQLKLLDSKIINVKLLKICFDNTPNLVDLQLFLDKNYFKPVQKNNFNTEFTLFNNRFNESYHTNRLLVKDMIKKYKIVGFIQVYNEIRKGNIDRFIKYNWDIFDDIVIYDDCSSDGTYELLCKYTKNIIRGTKNDFKNELSHKQQLLDLALTLNPDFIFWIDADEILPANAKFNLQKVCHELMKNPNIDALMMKEINIWRSSRYQRLDSLYGDGWFVRLWRVTKDMKFDTKEGLHQKQYPSNIKRVSKISLPILHYGFSNDLNIMSKFLTYRRNGQRGFNLYRLICEDKIGNFPQSDHLTLVEIPSQLFPKGLLPIFNPKDKGFTKRNFMDGVALSYKYKEHIFKPNVSIVCLIYKSVKWLKFVYNQVNKYLDMTNNEFYFVANDATDNVKKYLKENYIPHKIWENTDEHKKEWYIRNIYRAYNYGSQLAKGDYLFLINSDMAFNYNTLPNLLKRVKNNNFVVSRLIESGRMESGLYGFTQNFGKQIEEYKEKEFLEYSEKVAADRVEDNGLYGPLLIRKEYFDLVDGYPEGNPNVMSDITNVQIARSENEILVPGDVYFSRLLQVCGIQHQTVFDSIAYHFQCGEMTDKSTDKKYNNIDVVLCNDYLTGINGEKVLWNFMLEGLPNIKSVDKDVLKGKIKFEDDAKNYINNTYKNCKVIIQNATFMDLVDKSKFNIVYLQDNLRAMANYDINKRRQQEINLRDADAIVTNCMITACSYPEYDMEIIPIGINSTLFTPLDKKTARKTVGVGDYKKVGIFVGAFNETKGWSKIKSLIEKRKDIFWILVNKYEDKYEAGNVRCFNGVKQEELVKLLNSADFFILGSPVETQGLAALEALLCGIPVIMNNTGIFKYEFTDKEKDKCGLFDGNFEKNINEVYNKKFNPNDIRQVVFDKGLDIVGMNKKWETVLQKYNHLYF